MFCHSFLVQHSYNFYVWKSLLRKTKRHILIINKFNKFWKSIKIMSNLSTTFLSRQEWHLIRMDQIYAWQVMVYWSTKYDIYLKSFSDIIKSVLWIEWYRSSEVVQWSIAFCFSSMTNRIFRHWIYCLPVHILKIVYFKNNRYIKPIHMLIHNVHIYSRTRTLSSLHWYNTNVLFTCIFTSFSYLSRYIVLFTERGERWQDKSIHLMF
jgi:hypothetical protein